jgi:hypothetical protein
MINCRKCVVPLMVALLLLFSGCQEELKMPKIATGESLGGSLDNVSASTWKTLAGKRIFFGHQSVGENILDGVGILLKEHSAIRLKIAKFHDPSVFASPVLAHAEVGRNGEPVSKSSAFEQILDAGVGNRADIAFFKYCYADIRSDADAMKTMYSYRAMVRRVKEKYPNLTLAHVTVPLYRQEMGFVTNLKTLVKKIIGKKVGGPYANIGRERLNDLIRKEYGGKDPLFDLAEIESTSPSGEHVTVPFEGKVYPTLYSGFTSDGGHLNEAGQRIVAEQFLLFLARVAENGK